MRWIFPTWCLVAALALFVNLGAYPLFDADEGRNGEVGREMAATNDYVMPRLDGLPYVDKPIVYFAAEAAAMEVLGPTETAARLPALLFTLATAALIGWFARRVWGDPEAGWAAAIAMLSMPLTIAFSRTVIFDSALTFFVTAALVAFYLAVEGSRGREIAAWAAIGLGVITKGPVAIAVPLMIAIPYAISRKRFRALFSWWGLIAFVAIIAPWIWAVQQVVPDFLHYVLVTETMQRMATKALKRTGPPWYFLPYVIGGALPWTIVWVYEWARSRRKQTAEPRDAATLYAMLWLIIPFIFFSISQSKRPQYVLPLMPAIALLVARATRLRAGAIALLTFGGLLAAALPLEKVAPFRATAIALAVVFIIGGIVALVSRRREIAFIALSFPALAIPIVANPLLVSLGERRSTKSLVAQLRPYVTPGSEVAGIEAFTGSMAFYLRRPVTIYTPDAEETTSNYLIRHYATFTGAPQSPLKSMNDLPRALADRSRPRVWIVRNDDAANRARVEAHGYALVATGAHFVAYTMRR